MYSVLTMNNIGRLTGPIGHRQDPLYDLGTPLYAGAQSVRFQHPMLFTLHSNWIRDLATSEVVKIKRSALLTLTVQHL